MTGSSGELSGTAVIVTGGGRGLGRAMTEALVDAGASVVVFEIDQEPVDEVTHEIDGPISGFVGDVSDEGDAARAVEHCVATFGRVDVVVNNAGIGMSTIRAGDRYTNPIRFDEATPAAVRRFLDVHVTGPFLLSCAALAHFREQGSGHIVTVTTSLSTMMAEGNFPYGPVKAAAEAMTAVMSKDLAGTGITANILVPGGAADTRYVPDVPSRSRADLIKPVVMGPPMVFLASAAGADVTGTRIIAKNWDSSLEPRAAFEGASAPIGWPGL
jgi:3-oxoacyl-[acyl-carrier protein] reductase